MRKNLEKVIKDFESRKAGGSAGGSCWTNGNVIYSYQEAIVKRSPAGDIWILESYPSKTTQAQINSCKAHFDGHYGTVVTLAHILSA